MKKKAQLPAKQGLAWLGVGWEQPPRVPRDLPEPLCGLRPSLLVMPEGVCPCWRQAEDPPSAGVASSLSPPQLAGVPPLDAAQNDLVSEASFENPRQLEGVGSWEEGVGVVLFRGAVRSQRGLFSMSPHGVFSGTCPLPSDVTVMFYFLGQIVDVWFIIFFFMLIWVSERVRGRFFSFFFFN